MSKFSIILPVRNGGAYVKECVNSILAQSRQDFQLQVLDNCSTDGTYEWLQSLNDQRIVLYQADKGLTIEGNWARIKDVPKLEFMTMIGHDDVLYPNYLDEMDRLITRHPSATLYQAHYRYIDKNGNLVRRCLPMDEKQEAHEFLACQMMRTIDSTGTGYMMRSADYDRLGGMPAEYPNLIFADFALWMRFMLEGYKATTVQETFAYRVHDSVSRVTNGQLFADAFNRYIAFIIDTAATHPEIRETARRYGNDMLLYWCESLSHRLLKTPIDQRKWWVADFIRQCETYAHQLSPDGAFRPLDKFRIRIARQLDSSALGRAAFGLLKKIGG